MNYKDSNVIAYIALGSNKGDRQKYLKMAMDNIEADNKCILLNKSAVYESIPFGNIPQDNYLNAVISVHTCYTMKELYYALKDIEKKVGRTNSFRWGPREIDLDLLFFDEEIYSDSEITVPHKGIMERDFVIVPFCDIAPNYIHPEMKISMTHIDLTKIEKNIISKTDYKL